MSEDLSARYYKKTKRRIKKCLGIKIFLEKKKTIYSKRYKNLSENKIQKLVEYRKTYYEI